MKRVSKHSFERKAEKEVEGILPKEIRKSVKKFPLLYLLTIFILLIIISVLSINLFNSNNTLKQQKITLTALNKKLQTKANVLSTLQTNLNKTKAGQAILLAAEKQANQKAAASSQQASAAEAQSSKNAAALSATQSQLSSSQAQLSSSQASLNSVNAKLTSVQACVTLFNNAIPNINTYSYDMVQTANGDTQTIMDIGNYMNTNNLTYLTEAKSAISSATNYDSSATNLLPGIQSVLNQVKSGNCG